MICYTISSTPLQCKERGLPTEKISRADAVDRFLSSTATLLCSQTPSKLTLADIAGQAGLGQHYIHRFFGTRLDLLIEVSELLATRASKVLLGEIPQKTLSFDQFLERCRSVCSLRIQLTQYLSAQGVPETRFQEGNREIYSAISEFFQCSGVPPTRAVSNAIVLLAFIHAEVSLLPTLGLNIEEIEDLISLLMVA